MNKKEGKKKRIISENSWRVWKQSNENGIPFCHKRNTQLNRECPVCLYRGADKSLAQPGRKQARKHVREARDFNNIETRAVIKFFFSCKARRRRKFAPLAFFFPGRAKDLSAPLSTRILGVYGSRINTVSLVKFSGFRNSFINQCHTISSAVGNMKDESIDFFMQTNYQLGYRDRQYNLLGFA